MLKIRLTFQLDILLGISQNQKKKTKKIKLSPEKLELKRGIISKTPEYIYKIQSVYDLERRCFW